MKILGYASLLVLLGLATSLPAGAQYAAGNYRIMLEDELIRHFEFEARSDGDVTEGQLTFTDEALIPDGEVEDPEQGGPPRELYVKAKLDSMTVEKNLAILGGTVTDSSHKSYIGRWLQLVVEDSGEGSEYADRLTWRFCQPLPGSWVPTDAERDHDDGAYLRWWATDAERKDDVGVPSTDLLAKVTSCPVHPFAVYPFASMLKWEGDIVVRP